MDAEKVYNLVKKIPKGKVCTYGVVGKKLKIHPRIVGKILSRNPNLIKVPCHRVIKSSGCVGGYLSGKRKKTQLLRKEGIEIKNGKINIKKYLSKLKS